MIAAACRVRRVPRDVAATRPVVMTDLGTILLGAACPILASMVGAIREGRANHLRAGENVVTIGAVKAAGDHVAFFGDRSPFIYVIAFARQFQRVTVKVGKVGSDPQTVLSKPRALANSVACIHSARALGAQIRAPLLFDGTHGRRQLGTMGICPSEPAKISSAETNARDKE